jgi:hypothetical protein
MAIAFFGFLPTIRPHATAAHGSTSGSTAPPTSTVPAAVLQRRRPVPESIADGVADRGCDGVRAIRRRSYLWWLIRRLWPSRSGRVFSFSSFFIRRTPSAFIPPYCARQGRDSVNKVVQQK